MYKHGTHDLLLILMYTTSQQYCMHVHLSLPVGLLHGDMHTHSACHRVDAVCLEEVIHQCNDKDGHQRYQDQDRQGHRANLVIKEAHLHTETPSWTLCRDEEWLVLLLQRVAS